MSRFFRSGDSSSSSETEEEEEVDSGLESAFATNATQSDVNLSSSVSALSIAHRPASVDKASQQGAPDHRDGVLHALLEEWALNQTLRAHHGARREEPFVQAEAKTRYLDLVSKLAPLNIVSAGLENDRHATVRQTYRDGLDALSRQPTGATIPGARRLLTDGSADAAQPLEALLADPSSQNGDRDQTVLQAPLWAPGPKSPPSLGLVQHGVGSSLVQSRYHNEFEELDTLGRGGYGIVYKARNLLDDQEYAVKKVPLSAARLQRVRTRGPAELKDILMELRTLARLHHPNVVRYHTAWIEWTPGMPHGADFNSSGNVTSSQQDARAGAEDSRSGSLQLFSTNTADDLDGTGILFEHSGLTELRDSDDSPSRNHSSSNLQLRPTGTRSTIATASDETVESIEREPDVSASILSTAGGAQFAHSTLAIHIQMSLHPMTLADLLSNGRGDGDCLQHCYHLEPSVSIITAILDGLDYLHDEGVIHRDIKPANIFLSPTKRRNAGSNSVDLRKCGDCDSSDNATGAELDVCIGDFGLAAVANPETESSGDSPVGTAMYGPTTNECTSTSLDIYALGIVLFELLWKFGTRMERHDVIRELKEGRYPDQFCERMGKGRGVGTMECIDSMLAHHPTSKGSAEVREKLGALVTSST